jgi:hypothetical protein
VAAVGAAFAVVAPGAGAQTILNTEDVDNGQRSWLESWTTTGQTDNAGDRVRLSVLVKHAAGTEVTGLRIDDDYDGTDETASATIKPVTAQQPNVAGGYTYSRVFYDYNIPTTNTGMECNLNPFNFNVVRRTDNRFIRLRARLNTGAETASTSSRIKFIATSQCNTQEDYPYIYGQDQTATQVNVGQNVTFTYHGDDKDTTGDDDFDGIRWRLRRVNDGTRTATQESCPNNGDHAEKSLTVNFPRRGRWVVEANALNNDCSDNDGPNGSYWFYIGAVDVNSPASSSPTLSLDATRPQINGNTTVTATAADGSDSGELGRVEAIEWDLNENTSDQVNGYETSTITDYSNTDSPAGLSAAQLQKTIDTTGMTPGLHTVRARIGDNGALGGADSIRRTDTATTTFLVNTPPFANNQSFATETQTAVPITLDTGDANGDSLTYTITNPPDNGTLSGSGASRTYTPAVGFAGTDSFTYSVNDGFGGTDTATVTIRVDPDTTIDSAPTGTLDDRGAEFEFSSRATGATFECSLDGAAFDDCASPLQLTDLDDGSHELRVRAVAAGNTDQSPDSASWTIDAFPALSIDSGPDPETADIEATIVFTTSQAGATEDPTTECKLDAGEFRPCVSPVTYTDVDDGSHTVEVRATDAYGKQTTRSHSWSVDAIGSNTLIDSAPDAHTASTDAHLEFSSPDTAATFECKLDGDLAWADCTSAVDHSSLAEGSHTFRVRAIDSIGTADPTPATARWRVDLTAPDTTIDVAPASPGNDATPSFEFSADELNSTFECRVDSSSPAEWEACTTPLTTATLDEGSHTFDVRATDAVGNVEADPDSATFEIDLTAPSTAIVSGPADGSETATTATTFGFESPSDTGADFQCKLDSGNWRPCDGAASQAYSGLADGDHTFRVRAIDAAGNIDTAPPSRTWKVDTIAPQTSLAGGPPRISRDADASFDLNTDDADASFECSLDGAPFAACTSPQALTGLADGAHEFRARAVDALGNTDATPASREWLVDTSPRELPNQQPPPPPRQPCTFIADLPYCADPFMTAKADATDETGLKRGFGKLTLKANGGGANLDAARFELPAGLRVRTLGGGAKVGTLKTFGLQASQKTALSAGGELAAGPPRVALKAKGTRLVIDELPGKVRRLKVSLRSRAVVVEARDCGTAQWTGTLADRAGNLADIETRAEIRCLGGGR